MYSLAAGYRQAEMKCIGFYILFFWFLSSIFDSSQERQATHDYVHATHWQRFGFVQLRVFSSTFFSSDGGDKKASLFNGKDKLMVLVHMV